MNDTKDVDWHRHIYHHAIKQECITTNMFFLKNKHLDNSMKCALMLSNMNMGKLMKELHTQEYQFYLNE